MPFEETSPSRIYCKSSLAFNKLTKFSRNLFIKENWVKGLVSLSIPLLLRRPAVVKCLQIL